MMFTFLLACGSSQNMSPSLSIISQAYDGNPPAPVICADKEISCGRRCIDISSDNQNCGDCSLSCDISVGEFCREYYCRNVSDYGFSIVPRGPRQYDARKDLPYPSPIANGKNVK